MRDDLPQLVPDRQPGAQEAQHGACQQEVQQPAHSGSGKLKVTFVMGRQRGNGFFLGRLRA